MGKESIVDISGHKYRYEYENGKTRYVGPVGSAPEIGEEEFLRMLEEEPHIPPIEEIIAGHRDLIKSEKVLLDTFLSNNLQDMQDNKEKYSRMEEVERKRLFESLDDHFERYEAIRVFENLSSTDPKAADLLLEAGHRDDETDYKEPDEIRDQLELLTKNGKFGAVNAYRPVPVKNPKRYDMVRDRMWWDASGITDYARANPDDVFTFKLGYPGSSVFYGLPRYKA